MPATDQETADPIYTAGDILVAVQADGSYEISRVSANGRAAYVMGVQVSQPAALRMAERATSGFQRVFLRSNPASSEYLPVI